MLKTSPSAPPKGTDELPDLEAGTVTLRREIGSVGRHSLIYMLGPAISNLAGFVLIPVYTRFIDRGDYGIMSVVDVVMTMLMMILAMGVADGMTRFYYATSNDRERRILVSSAIAAPALISLPIILLAIFQVERLRPLLGISSDYVGYLQLALAAAWFSMLADIGLTYLRMCYLAKTFVAITLVQLVASLVLNLTFVVGFGWGIWGILYSTVIVQVTLGTVLTVLILWRSAALPRLSAVRQLLGFGIHLVPATVSLQLSNYLNPLMIRWLFPGTPVAAFNQVGLFSAGQKVGVVVNRFVTVPFNAFWRPRRMELVLQDTNEVRHILARICTYSTIITCQIALALSVAAEDLLRILVHPDYWSAYQVIPLIAAAYVVLSLEHHFGTGMHFAKKTKWATGIGLTALAILVLANLIALPRYGIIAAAASTLLSVSIRSGLFLWVSQRLYPIPFELRRLCLLAVVSVVLYGVSRWITISPLELRLLARLACATALIPSLVVLGFFSRGELASCWTMVRRGRLGENRSAN